MDKDSLILFKAHVRLHLGSKKVVLKYKLSHEVFDKLTKEIFDKFKKAISHAGNNFLHSFLQGGISLLLLGETIGAIAA